MYTNEMTLHKLFLRYCETHIVTRVSCHSKPATINLDSTFENPLIVKVAKFKSIEQFILMAEQKGIMKMLFKITAPVKHIDSDYNTNFLLETVDGELEIVFRDS